MTEERRRQLGVVIHVVIVLLGLTSLGLGLWLLWDFARSQRTCHRAKKWACVPATIESVRLKVHRRAKRETYYLVEATYTYEYEGRRYTGMRVMIEVFASEYGHPGARWRHEVLADHQRRGQPYPAWVNPARPQEALLFRDLSPLCWVALHYGLGGTVAGAVFIGAAVRVARRDKRRELRLKLDPARPWRAEDQWAVGFTIAGRRATKMLLLWGAPLYLAAFWGALAVPALVLALGGKLPAELRRLFLIAGLGYAAIVLCLFAGCARQTLRLIKYGVPRLALAEMPIVPGRSVPASVRCRGRLVFRRTFVLRLKCVRRPGAKGSRQDTLFEDSRDVPLDQVTYTVDGTAIPATIEVPADQGPTRNPGRAASVTWTLEARGAVAGVGFAEVFELPVFAVAATDLIEYAPNWGRET